MSFCPDFMLVLIQIVVFVWGVVTLPFYFLACQPWVKTRAFKQVLSLVLSFYLQLVCSQASYLYEDNRDALVLAVVLPSWLICHFL